MLVHLLCAVAVNANSGPNSDGPTDVLDTLPFVLFTVLTLHPSNRDGKVRFPAWFPGLNPILDNAVPFAMPASAMLGSVWIARHHGIMGAVSIVLATLLYGCRSTLVQMAYQGARAEADLARDAMRELSLTDGLTSVRNRRFFDDALLREWSTMERAGAPLSLLMVDVDYFKMVNDHFGHADGDVCLRQVAHVLSAALQRESDTLARYGGEEFAVLLPTTDLHGALLVARRMHQVVERLRLRNRTPLGDFVTISIGAATCRPGEHGTAAKLLEAADGALFAAKARGRNRTEVGSLRGAEITEEAMAVAA